MPLLRSLLLTFTISLLFSACTNSEIPLTPKSAMFKLGESDGCSTAIGEYTKNSENFKNSSDYANGWFAGRKKCNPINSQK